MRGLTGDDKITPLATAKWPRGHRWNKSRRLPMQVALPFIGRRAALGRVGGLLLVLGAGRVWADDSFPNKPIRIVPFGTAGGPIDSIARVYGEALKQRWNQPIVVDAKPGASGI